LSATRFSTAPIASTRSKIVAVNAAHSRRQELLAGSGENVASENRARRELVGRFAITLIFEQPLDQIALQLFGSSVSASSGCGSIANDLINNASPPSRGTHRQRRDSVDRAVEPREICSVMTLAVTSCGSSSARLSRCSSKSSGPS